VKGIQRYLSFLTTVLWILILGCSTIPANQGSEGGNLESRVESLEKLKPTIDELLEMVTMLQASGVGAATQIYARDCTGAAGDDTCGTKNMADISTAAAGDKVMVFNTTDSVYAFYKYETSGITESYPDQVDDDNDGGTAGWRLLKGRVDGFIPFGSANPDGLLTATGRGDQTIPFWCNWTTRTMNIQEVYAWSDTDDYKFFIVITGSSTDWGTGNDEYVETSGFTVSNNGTSVFYGTNPWDSGFEYTAVASGECLLLQHDDISDVDANYVYGYIKGYLN